LTTLDNLIYLHNQTHQISFVYDLKRYDIKSPLSVPQAVGRYREISLIEFEEDIEEKKEKKEKEEKEEKEGNLGIEFCN
jgi:hypothetical protein